MLAFSQQAERDNKVPVSISGDPSVWYRAHGRLVPRFQTPPNSRGQAVTSILAEVLGAGGGSTQALSCHDLLFSLLWKRLSAIFWIEWA